MKENTIHLTKEVFVKACLELAEKPKPEEKKEEESKEK